jgi:hypothetical protein
MKDVEVRLTTEISVENHTNKCLFLFIVVIRIVMIEWKQELRSKLVRIVCLGNDRQRMMCTVHWPMQSIDQYHRHDTYIDREHRQMLNIVVSCRYRAPSYASFQLSANRNEVPMPYVEDHL